MICPKCEQDCVAVVVVEHDITYAFGHRQPFTESYYYSECCGEKVEPETWFDLPESAE